MTSSVDYISNKFDEYEEESKKKDKQIKCLQEPVSFLENKNGEIEHQRDGQGWYSKRNWLLIHGMEERGHEVTGELVIQTITSQMDIDIHVKDIDQTHRIGAKTENKCQPILVKFAGYLERHKRFNSTERKNGKTLSITESLTKLRMGKLRAASDE